MSKILQGQPAVDFASSVRFWHLNISLPVELNTVNETMIHFVQRCQENRR